MTVDTKTIAAALVALSFSLGAGAAIAGGAHSGGHEDGKDIGQAGKAGHVDRVIKVKMGEMFFSPSDIEVQKGETIRFVVTNTGEFVHEFNIATKDMHLAHADEMMKMMDSGALEADSINHDLMNATGMAHKDANSILLEPGKSAELIWTFNGNADLELSCNIPGHRESGMMQQLVMNDTDS